MSSRPDRPAAGPAAAGPAAVGQPADGLLGMLVPGGVAAVEAFDDVPGAEVFPGEEAIIARAVPGRRREFVTARRCAREALGHLGAPPVPILSGDRREPRWPPGFVGAITHCVGYRAAAVARDTTVASVGIDAEPHGPLPDGVLRSVSSPGEREHLAALTVAHPQIWWQRVLFSAKESVYKAWFPLTGRWLGFEDAELVIDADAGAFTASLRIDGARTDGGPPLVRLDGRFLIARGLVLTALTVP